MYEVHQWGSKPRVECSGILKFLYHKIFGSKRDDQNRKTNNCHTFNKSGLKSLLAYGKYMYEKTMYTPKQPS